MSMIKHQQADQKQRYAIRKMTVGIGSVLIGFLFLTGQAVTVRASEQETTQVLLLAADIPEEEPTILFSDSEPTTTTAIPTLASSETPNDSTAEITEVIATLPAPNYYDDQAASIAQQNAIIKAGEALQFSLTTADGTIITDQVTWYVKTKYPEDRVYQAGEFVKGENHSELLRLDTNGLLTNINNQEKTQPVDLFAHYNKHLYHTSVTLSGTIQTETIRQHEEASKVADDIIKTFVHLSDVEKVKAAHDWLVEHVHYVDRPGKDQTAYSALVEKQTVCAGYANALKLMLDKMGIPNHTKTGTITGGELHLWNIVELDGQWYHVDATWDYPGNSTRPYSPDRGYNHKNKYLLIHDQDFARTNGAKRDYFPIPEEKAGEQYRYYGFEKKGVLARTIDDVATVLDRQYQKVPFKAINTVLELMAPADLSLHHIGNQLANILGHAHYSTHSANYGSYTLHRFAVKLFPSWSTKDVEPVITVNQLVIDDTTQSEKVSSVLVTLDQDIELTTANFTVTDARLIKAIRLDGKTYKLILDHPKQITEATVTVAIHKRKHKFQLDNPTLAIKVNRLETPQAIFTATGERQGILSNLKAGMVYRIGQNNWQQVEGEYLKLTDIGTTDLYIRLPETEQALSSAIQHIEIKKAPDPTMAKALPGKIVGVTPHMEYRRQGEEIWHTSRSNVLTDLVAGTYEIRNRATGSQLASNIKTVVLETGVESDQPETNTSTEAERYTITTLPKTIKVGQLLTPDELIANRDDLPTTALINWAGIAPSIRFPGTSQYVRVRITFSDASFKEVAVRISTELNDAQQYIPVGTIKRLSVGTALRPDELIANRHDLPEETRFEWALRPNLRTPGSKLARVNIIYPDGSSTQVSTRITLH